MIFYDYILKKLKVNKIQIKYLKFFLEYMANSKIYISLKFRNFQLEN